MKLCGLHTTHRPDKFTAPKTPKKHLLKNTFRGSTTFYSTFRGSSTFYSTVRRHQKLQSAFSKAEPMAINFKGAEEGREDSEIHIQNRHCTQIGLYPRTFRFREVQYKSVLYNVGFGYSDDLVHAHLARQRVGGLFLQFGSISRWVQSLLATWTHVDCNPCLTSLRLRSRRPCRCKSI